MTDPLTERLHASAGAIRASLRPALETRRAAEHARRVRHVVAATLAGVAVVIVALGVGLASQQHLSTPPLPATHPHASLGRLAYVSDGDMYLADWDGRNPVRIADGPSKHGDGCGSYWAEGSIWSPDGRYLAYRGDAAGASGSCRATVNISDPTGHRVASFPGVGWLISWSPDSTRLATWVTLWHTIGIYGLDGARQALLTLPAGLMAPGDFDPVWSPDGQSLSVPHGVEIPLDGSPPRALPVDDPRSSYWLSYSPDGAQIAYTTQDGALHVAAADGSHARILIPVGVQAEGDRGPVWSPTGDRIAFETLTGQETTGIGPATQLHLVEVATGKLTSLAGQGESDYLRAIEFSPEGDRILFSRTVANHQRDAEPNVELLSSLWSVDADGSFERVLVSGTYGGDWQAVSPTR